MSYDFQMVRKGYNPDEVDAYIEELENQLNEYKEKSSTINKAIINAQIAADNIIKAAHSETEKILSQAKKEATDLKQATINQIKYLKDQMTTRVYWRKEPLKKQYVLWQSYML